jgi:cytochrome c-type biogenesis protein
MHTSTTIAFLAGIVSVFSPCIIPLIPAYFAYMTGVANSNTSTTTPSSKKILLHGILFSLGFTVVFLLFGAVIGTIGKFFAIHRRTIEIIGGIIIILLSLQIAGLFKFFRKEFKLPLQKTIAKKFEKASPIKSLLTGMIFAFGWSPCYGPILGSILALTITQTSTKQGIILFGLYALGMAITLIAIALLASKVSNLTTRTRKIGRIFTIIMAILLLLLGLGMLTGETGNLANTINNLYIKYNIDIF